MRNGYASGRLKGIREFRGEALESAPGWRFWRAPAAACAILPARIARYESSGLDDRSV